MKSLRLSIIALLVLIVAPATFAQEQSFPNDLFISAVKVDNYVLLGDQVRFYVEVGSGSAVDLKGVVQIYDEKLGKFIGAEQPVSVLAGSTDSVFFDYVLTEKTSTREFNVRILPDDPTGDNSGNNTQRAEIYVDVDTDGDGQPNQTDEDDDNDGVKDDEDAFRLDPNESADTDGDGIGDNADSDDDNDGVEDLLDAFPLDPNESEDLDGDGVGDNEDAFPNDPKETQDSDDDGLGDNADTNDDNKGPIVSLSTAETVVPTLTTITFSAYGSSDPDGELVGFEWDFGDGEMATGEMVDHAFRKSGDYQVRLVVTDDVGETRTEVLTMTVVHKWQVYVLGGLALLLFLLLILYWIFSRKKRGQTYDEMDEKVHDLVLGNAMSAQEVVNKKPVKKKSMIKKSTSPQTTKKKANPKKPLPKKKK